LDVIIFFGLYGFGRRVYLAFRNFFVFCTPLCTNAIFCVKDNFLVFENNFKKAFANAKGLIEIQNLNWAVAEELIFY
jgi:hypothetical protein